MEVTKITNANLHEYYKRVDGYFLYSPKGESKFSIGDDLSLLECEQLLKKGASFIFVQINWGGNKA